MVDFPAAHSMDTTWFAIDADGCVGIFDSGEGGALPKDLTACHSESIQFGSELLELLAADNGILIDRDAVDIDFIFQNTSLQNLKSEIKRIKHLNKKHDKHTIFSLYRLLLITSSELTAKALQEQSKIYCEIFNKDGQKIIYINNCGVEWLNDEIDAGSIAAGSNEIILEFNLNLLGWHVYKSDSSSPDVYTRNRLPRKPIYFQDLPAIIMDKLRITELPNLRFMETDAIQPIEQMPCDTWGGTQGWWGTDGEWHEGFPDYSIPYSERFPDRK